jgi:predicted N-acetyltransferase YhbS
VASDDSIRIRRATSADAEALAGGVIEGIEDYPSFAPPGWTAPSFQEELKEVREALADTDVCCLVAESGIELVGQITLLPAARAAHPVDDSSLAHISNLIVRRDHWGGGLASALHRAALEAADARGLQSYGSSWQPDKQGPGASMSARDGGRPATRSPDTMASRLSNTATDCATEDDAPAPRLAAGGRLRPQRMNVR